MEGPTMGALIGRRPKDYVNIGGSHSFGSKWFVGCLCLCCLLLLIGAFGHREVQSAPGITVWVLEPESSTRVYMDPLGGEVRPVF